MNFSSDEDGCDGDNEPSSDPPPAANPPPAADPPLQLLPNPSPLPHRKPEFGPHARDYHFHRSGLEKLPWNTRPLQSTWAFWEFFSRYQRNTNVNRAHSPFSPFSIDDYNMEICAPTWEALVVRLHWDAVTAWTERGVWRALTGVDYIVLSDLAEDGVHWLGPYKCAPDSDPRWHGHRREFTNVTPSRKWRWRPGPGSRERCCRVFE